jgi:hypothetical protein
MKIGLAAGLFWAGHAPPERTEWLQIPILNVTPPHPDCTLAAYLSFQPAISRPRHWDGV